MEKITNINRKDLRDFGLVAGTITALLFGLILPWLRGHSLPLLPWIIALILGLLALLTPLTLKPIYRIWMKIGEILGWINTRIILALIFYGMMLPMGLVMRLLKRDTMNRKFKGNALTYRLVSQHRNKVSMEKPF